MANTFKKFLALVLVLSLVMGMTGMAYAADEDILDDEPLPVEDVADVGYTPTEDGEKLETTFVTDEVAAEVTEGSVAKIGDVGYATLQAAIDAAGEGQTVTLLNDDTYGATIPAGKTITLNVPAGITLSNENSTVTGSWTQSVLINKGNLTLNCEGNLETKQGKGGFCLWNDVGGVANINGGTFTTYNGDYIIFNHGTATIDGATLNKPLHGASYAIIANGRENPAVLTIEECTVNDTSNVGIPVCNYGSGAVTINGGTFTGQIPVQNGGTAVINGGTFIKNYNDPTDKDEELGLILEYGKLTINGGNFCNGTSNKAVNVFCNYSVSKNDDVTITGGTFFTNPTDYVAEGYIATENTDSSTWTVELDTSSNYWVAKVEETGVLYSTLQAAITAATSGQTVTLLHNADWDLPGNVSITEDITLDLGGNKLEIKGVAGKTLNNERTHGITVEDGGSLTILNGSLNSTSTQTTSWKDYNYNVLAVILVRANSSLSLNKVTYTTNGTAMLVAGDAASISVVDSSVTAAAYAVGTNANKPENCGVEIELTNSDFYSYTSAAVLMNVIGHLNMDTCNLTGASHGLIVRGGTAVAKDCTIKRNCKDYNSSESTAMSTAMHAPNAKWSSGNMVPFAAITLGEKGSTSYQYPTHVTLINTGVASEDPNNVKFPAIYVYDNGQTKNRVTLIIDKDSAIDETTSTGIVRAPEDCKAVIAEPVAMVEETGVYYHTIQDAITAAGDGETVTLLNDATESVVIASGKEITLDLNGNMLTGAKNAKGEMANVITNRGILTIKDSSGDNSGTVMGGTDTNQEGNVGRKGIAVVNEIGATCTIESGTIKRGDDGTFGNYTVQNKSKMYIKGGLITNNSNKSNLVVNYNRSADGKQFGTEDVYMEISGGTVRQTSMSAIKNEPGSVLHITGEATVIERTMGEKNTNFASNFYGTVIMDGGTLTTDGLLGFFSHKNPDGTEFAGDFTITGDAKVVCNEIRLENGISGGVTAAVPTLTISGNVSVTANNLYQLRVDGNKLYTVSDNIANIDISGGTFNKDVIKYVIPNYKTLYNNNGTWTVVPNYVASIGATDYMTIAEAINAGNGHTVTLLRSTTESVVIPSDKNITLDLNGHTLTAANSHAITNNGELTIVDSSDGKTGKVDGGEVAGSGAIFNNIEAIATLNGGTFTGSKWYVIKNLGNMTIAEGAVVDQKDNGSSGIDNGWYNSLLTDGHVNDCGVPHIDADLVAELTITGGTFTGGLNTVKNDDYGTLNIQGGTHSNTTQHVIMNWNVATISGGTFIASDAATLAVWNNDSSKNNTSNQGSMSISGGMFSSAVKPDWCATGYLPTNGGSTEGAPYSVDRSTITLTANPASVTGSRTVALIVSAPENLEGEIVVTGATGAPAPEKGSDDRTWTVSVPNADATYAFNVGLKLSDGTVRNFNSATVSVTRYVAPSNPSTPSTPDEPDEPVVDIEDDPTALGDRPFIFEDVHEEDWFYADVKSIFENGLINGTTTTTYEPQTELTRGMIVTILWRIAGEPTVEATSTFADVPENAYYFNAINWGAANNIARGYDEETFAPDRLVSREELAAFIYRYSELIELDLTGIDEEAFAEFGDAESVLPWFVENVKWAISAGIVKGEDGMLLPQDRATRAEAAAMVNRFIQMPEVAAIMQANAEAETATDAE